jgi:hypothetical protein
LVQVRWQKVVIGGFGASWGRSGLHRGSTARVGPWNTERRTGNAEDCQFSVHRSAFRVQEWKLVEEQYDAFLADYGPGDEGEAELEENEKRLTVRNRFKAAAARWGWAWSSSLRGGI